MMIFIRGYSLTNHARFTVLFPSSFELIIQRKKSKHILRIINLAIITLQSNWHEFPVPVELS
jgi:hypothetical protein